MSWLREKFKGYPCALPPSLIDPDDGIGLPHNDWPWGLNWIPRSWNARGPRCKKGSPGYMKWPPFLREGKGVSRWETDGSTSIIEIPSLNDRHVKSIDVYKWEFRAIERKEGHPNQGKEFMIKIDWKEGLIPGQYHPSALQKFSDEGYMKCDPNYYAKWKMIKKREISGSNENAEDTVLFYRHGARPDSLDIYYSMYSIYIGGHWE